MQREPMVTGAEPPYRYVYRKRRWRLGPVLPLLFAVAMMGAAYRVAFPPQKALRQRGMLNFLGSLPQTESTPGPEPAAVLGRRFPELPAQGSPHSVRIFASGLPLHPIVDELRKSGLPVDTATSVERQRADLVVQPATAAAPAGTALVGAAGQVTLSLPPHAGQRLPIYASQLLAPRLPVDNGLLAAPGLEREYDKVAEIASVAARARQLGSTSSLPEFVNGTPNVRVIPALTVLNAGDSQGVDFQIQAAGGEWYSLTERSDVRFQVLSRSGALVPHASAKGVFCSPAETEPRYDGERITIEAAINSPDFPSLTARALFIVRVPGPSRP